MSNVSKLTEGYLGFFKKMGEFSYSHYSSTFSGIHKCIVPHANAMSASDTIVGGLYAGLATFALSPILLPLTAVIHHPKGTTDHHLKGPPN